MPNIFFTDEEILSIVDHFNDAEDMSFNETIYHGLKKMADSIGIELELVKCDECEEYFVPLTWSAPGRSLLGICPNCGEEVGLIKINDHVRLPTPTGNDAWRAGGLGVITGLENVDGKTYAIVLCEYEAAWFIEASRLERI